MSLLWFYLVALSGLCVVASSIALVFQKWRPRAIWIAPGSFIALIGFLILFQKSVDDDARLMGFLNNADFHAAVDAGVSDPSVWKSRRAVATRTEEERRVEAERLRQTHVQAEASRARREEQLAPPAIQLEFTAAVERGREQYKAGQNDIQRSAARSARAEAICAAMPSPRFDDWIGKVHELSANRDGDRGLAIKIADGLILKTWNNFFADMRSQTLIKPNTLMHQRILGLKIGDVVRFSGQMFPEPSNCYREISGTLDSSLQEPQFLVRFSDIYPVN